MRGLIGAGVLTLALCSVVQARAQDARATQSAGAPADQDELKAGSLPVPALPADASLPQIAPIIPDDEFNAAIPALDPQDDAELDKPLESIADFERRLASEQADAAPSEGLATPLGDPALADGDAIEEIGDAPVRDAELAAPLPPIDQFEVTPVEFAEAEEAEDDVEVGYSVQLNGLELADKETETSLKSQFNSLSALKHKDGKAANAAMVSARLTEDGELVRNILASEGWYDPTVLTRLDLGDMAAVPADGTAVSTRPALTAVIDVTPGKRFTLSEIVVKADPTDPPGLIEQNLALKVGEPIVAQRIQGAEAQVAIILPENGYPFAEIGQRDILLDQRTGDGVYTLPVTVGPKARFGGFVTDGDLAFDAGHIDVLARFNRGDLYDSREVDDLRKALVATGLFSTVGVEPVRTGEQVGDGTEYVNMHVAQDAGPPRTIAGSVGYAAGQGFTLEGSWTHRNMFPPEGALIAHGIAGTQEQGAGVTFRRSNAGRRDRTFEVVAEVLRSDYDAYDAYTGRLAARVSRDSTPIWQKKITYAYGVQLIGTAERDYDFLLAERNRRTYYIGGLTGQIGFDQSNDLLDPTKGYRLTAVVEPEGSLKDGFNPYVRARLDASGYFPFGDSIVLAGRLRVGTIQGASRVDIAPSRRFYSGGGGSVRGFGYQKLGDLDPNGDPIGGRSLNEASAEVRYRFGNFGVVGFVDVGQSYTETMPQFSNLRYGAGIGGRFYTNFGPMRLDVATPIDRRPGEARFNLYVSIGQAF